MSLRSSSSDEERRIIKWNRSQAYLEIQCFGKALDDLGGAPLKDACFKDTAYNRAYCLHRLRRYEGCRRILMEMLKEFPSHGQAYGLLKQSMQRLHEQRCGRYDFRAMHEAANQSDPRLDTATFSKPVAVRPSRRHGLGIFTVKDVSVGDLLLCEAPISFCFANSSATTYTNEYNHHSIRGKVPDLLTTTVQNLFQCSPLMEDFTTLYRGDYVSVKEQEVDGRPIVDT